MDHETQRRLVRDGGVLWRCTDCRASGVLRGHTVTAKQVRLAAGVPAPRPLGVAFSRDHNCPACGVEKVVDAEGRKLPDLGPAGGGKR